MPLFNASTIAWATAVQQIADCIGASGDDEMRNRAHRSLRAAFQYIGGKSRWDFMRTELAPQVVIAPFTVTGVTASAGQVSAAAPAGHGISADDLVVASGFMLGTRVTATAASGFGVTVAVTATVAGFNAQFTRDMYAAPSDMRNGYTVRLLSSQRTLDYFQRRRYDRLTTDEFTGGSVYWYDLFVLGSKSKIRLLPAPGSGANDILLQRYYRRFTLASASAASTALDIPEDYEETPLAWAKWHFLTDKGEGRKDQATSWMNLAQDGIKVMLAEQTNLPDENLGMVPGHMTGPRSDRSTRWIEWDMA